MGQQMSQITLTISNPPGVIRVNIENEMFAKGYLMLRAKWGGRKKGQGYKCLYCLRDGDIGSQKGALRLFDNIWALHLLEPRP